MNRKHMLVALALWGGLSVPAVAQEGSDRTLSRVIRVTNQATVTSPPDQAQLDLGVVSQAPTAQEAAASNVQRVDAVLQALRQALPSDTAIETQSYRLSPQYRHPQEGKAPVISGYTATNLVQIRTDQLAQLGTIIDAALQAGANHVERIQFTLKDESAVQTHALRKATQQARAHAETLAAAADVGLGDVLSITTSESPPVQPLGAVAMRADASGFAPPTPIEPGTIEVHATVTLAIAIRESMSAEKSPAASQPQTDATESENVPAPKFHNQTREPAKEP